MIPGTQKKNERMRLIQTSESQLFFFKNTARGGSKIAKMMRRMSLLSAILNKIKI